MKKVVIVARDKGPCNSLRLVAAELEKQGHEVTTAFGEGQAFPEGTTDKLKASVSEADVVLIAMSSSEARAKEEIMAGIAAHKRGIKLGLFCDSYGTFRRSWFKGLLSQADFLFVINNFEAQIAREFAVTAQIVASGNPDWATYFDKPKYSRNEVRTRLGAGVDEKLILSVGSKEPGRNFLLWAHLIMATNKLQGPLNLVLARHPGEQNPEELYAGLLEYCVHPITFLSGMSSGEIIAGVNLVVSSLSTVGIAAACRQIPVIDFVTDLDEKWLEKLSGTTIWPPAIAQATWQTTSTEDLRKAIGSLLNHNSHESQEMKKFQTEAFSLEKVAGATQKIVTTLTK